MATKGGKSRKTRKAVSTVGTDIANAIIARRRHALARRAKALAAHPVSLEVRTRILSASGRQTMATSQTLGHLVALGDSWFDYPFNDIIDLLEDDYGYTIESCAHAGDRVEAMAYSQGGQLEKLARSFEKVVAQGAVPKAVLVSGGGDDIAGEQFGMLLNSANSQIGGWNDEVVDGVINQRIAAAYRTMLDAIGGLSQHYAGATLPVLIHGYDYAVPDGRGFLGGWWLLPGPWLQPGFTEKQFDDLAHNTGMVQGIIDRFNNMLSDLVRESTYAHVRYIDLRGTLTNQLQGRAYQKWWANELHPEEKGFKAVTARFAQALAAL